MPSFVSEKCRSEKVRESYFPMSWLNPERKRTMVLLSTTMYFAYYHINTLTTHLKLQSIYFNAHALWSPSNACMFSCDFVLNVNHFMRECTGRLIHSYCFSFALLITTVVFTFVVCFYYLTYRIIHQSLSLPNVYPLP